MNPKAVLAFIALAGCIAVGDSSAQARVISISDGDTLIVTDGALRTVIRLAEVDAPERTVPYSQVARRNLARLCLAADDVRFEPIDIDRYGRTVAHVWCDGVNASWQQVADGLAWCFVKYLRHPDECLPREREAREAQRGLWRDPAPVAPWDWRAAQRGGGN